MNETCMRIGTGSLTTKHLLFLLTGPSDEVKRICNLLGSNFWPDEGTLTHSLHTLIIDRKGKLSADIEGNQFTGEQLGDLVQTYS